jgi:hypothetical protein
MSNPILVRESEKKKASFSDSPPKMWSVVKKENPDPRAVGEALVDFSSKTIFIQISKPPKRIRKKRPFIVREIDARMLRKHPEVSKNARMLWVTMLSMADAKTGGLRHRDHWYSGEEIDSRAEISRFKRKPLMQELVLAGYVHWERERIRRVLKDRLTGRLRMRCVSGRTKYFISKSPRKDWLSNIAAQKSPRKHWGPSKVQFSQPLESRNTPNKTGGQNEKSPHEQRPSSKGRFFNRSRICPASLSVNHQEAGVGVSGVGAQVQIAISPSSSVSGTAPVEKIDDDVDIPLRTELLLKEATAILVSNGHDRDYVEIALDFIEQRAVDLAKTPATAQYYLASFKNLDESLTEKDWVWEQVRKRRERYAKFGIPLDPTTLQLTPAQDRARQDFNERLRSL